MKEQGIIFKSFKPVKVLIPILIFLSVQVISLLTYPILSDISQVLFTPLTNLLFLNGFLIYIITASSKILDSLTRSYYIAKNSKEIILDEEIIKKMLGFLIMTITVTILYTKKFFETILILNSYSPIYVFVIILVSVAAILTPVLFIIQIFYVAKYKKNEVDDVLMTLNFINQINDEDIHINTKLNLEEHEAKFNCLIDIFMNNKNKDNLIRININNSEYWNNLKKGTVPPDAK